MVPRKRILSPAGTLSRSGEDGSWMETNDLHIIWQGVLRDQLQCQLARVLR